MTLKAIVNIAEKLGWCVSLNRQLNGNGGFDKYADFEQYSPAGEDFAFTVFYKNSDELYNGICEYYEDFDEEEHVMTWLDAKRGGVSGVPSVVVLVHDAEAIAEMLEELYTALVVSCR